VVARARARLEALEREHVAAHPAPPQLDLFQPPPGPDPVHEALEALDPDGMTPRQALEALYRLKSLEKGDGGIKS
jgi:DNA mismatch repair protein MutS